MASREGLEFETTIVTDSAALHWLVADMLAVSSQIRCLRDPTRGGLASTLNEIAEQSEVSIEIDEKRVFCSRRGSRRLRDARTRPVVCRE